MQGPATSDHSSSNHRSGFIGDETRYHSQLDEFRSGNNHTDITGEDDLFFDCNGRTTPNLGTS